MFIYLVLLHAAIYVYYYMTIIRCQWCTCSNSLRGKTVLITGGNTGIGLETATELARRGARVILTCRSIPKGLVAQKRIIAATGNHRVCYRLLDLTSFRSIRNFVNEIERSESRIDVLINNAGTGDIGNFLTEDGVVVEAQVNYYGLFLMTLLLTDLMKRSIPSRIVNVASSLHRFGKINPATFDQPVRGFWARKRMFANCKLAVILFTFKLSRELEGSGVTVNCFNPGVVYTKQWGSRSALTRAVLRRMLRPAVHGAQTAVHLAVARSLQGVTGRYYEDCSATTPSPRALDKKLADRLWRASERVVGIRDRYFNA